MWTQAQGPQCLRLPLAPGTMAQMCPAAVSTGNLSLCPQEGLTEQRDPLPSLRGRLRPGMGEAWRLHSELLFQMLGRPSVSPTPPLVTASAGTLWGSSFTSWVLPLEASCILRINA